jgi:uncharacterized membrane protein
MPVSEKEQQQINSLVRRFEAETGIEAVAAVVGKADAYPEIPWKAYAIGSAFGALAAVFVPFLDPLERLVRARDRCAVLMLVTRFERVAVILPDAGLAQYAPPAELDRIARAMRDALVTKGAPAAFESAFTRSKRWSRLAASSRIRRARTPWRMRWLRRKAYESGLARAILLIVVLAGAAAAADVPFLTGRVGDEAEVLSSAARERITGVLRAHEQRTSDQVAVLTVRSLGGNSIEEYAVAVFESWKLGQKGKDNGGSSSSCRRSATCA